MKAFLLLLVSFFALVWAAPAQVRTPNAGSYVVYAQFLEDTKITLSDGSTWQMDKGDCFPVYMFKNQQTRVILTLGSDTFSADMSVMRVMKDAEAPEGLKSYRKTLESYLKGRADHWKKEATSDVALPEK